MAQNIEPYRQTVQACLKDKTYYIDFYQREYVWSDETVKILLDDIFEVFEQSYFPVKDAEMNPDVMEKFNWYYMNVFITNKIDNKTYIVDGQQRLSTLTLICTKLYHLSNDKDLKDLLLPCICGKNWKNNEYRIDNAKELWIRFCMILTLYNPILIKQSKLLLKDTHIFPRILTRKI